MGTTQQNPRSKDVQKGNKKMPGRKPDPSKVAGGDNREPWKQNDEREEERRMPGIDRNVADE